MTNKLHQEDYPYMSLPSIETLDVDGALRDSEAALGGVTRAAFFRKAAVGGGAVLTSGAIMGMLPELAAAKPSKKQDVKILKYALTLEYLEAAFYKGAVDSGVLTGDAAAFAALVAAHEQTHVEFLQKALGGKSKAPKSPEFDFKGSNTDPSTFVDTAFVLENTGVHAYLGQAGRIKQTAILGAAGSILTIEARHAAAIAVIKATDPYSDKSDFSITPDGAFDKPLSMAKVLAAVGKTGFIKS
jgi:hypothetical protein